MVNRSHVALIVAGTVGVLSLAAVITLIVLWLTTLTPFKDYALVVDAGSTHSNIFLYTYVIDRFCRTLPVGKSLRLVLDGQLINRME